MFHILIPIPICFPIPILIPILILSPSTSLRCWACGLWPVACGVKWIHFYKFKGGAKCFHVVGDRRRGEEEEGALRVALTRLDLCQSSRQGGGGGVWPPRVLFPAAKRKKRIYRFK